MYERASTTHHNEAGRLTTGYSLEADCALPPAPLPFQTTSVHSARSHINCPY